ncbi:MAG TPA: response regulator transcription factor [Anaerolineales bacterium]|nr:response regulator transcription factor [Anaerolineales bacterium]
MPDPIRILVADDHPVVRDGLIAMLGTQPDFQIAGSASTGSEVVRRTVELQPDILLLDLEMPEIDGVEALRQLRLIQPEIRVLVFTAFDTDERILGAVRAGARGYLLKGAPREEIFNAIRIVSQGGSLLQPVVAKKLIQRVAEVNQREQNKGLIESLTLREEEVLQLLARGMTNKEIASELVITERTVKFHVSSILRKMEKGNRTEAVRTAVELGLVKI